MILFFLKKVQKKYNYLHFFVCVCICIKHKLSNILELGIRLSKVPEVL